MNKVILFDIDYTLINTDLLREAFMENLVHILQKDTRSDLGSIASALIDIEMQLISEKGRFELNRYLEMIAHKYSMSPNLRGDLEKALTAPEMFKKSVYPEVWDVLKKLKGKIPAGVFSAGDVDFQHRKLQLSGLSEYLVPAQVNIFERKVPSIPQLLSKYQNVDLTVVDDRVEALEAIKQQRLNILALWVHRGKYADKLPKTKEYAPNYEIRNLSEIFNVIEI